MKSVDSIFKPAPERWHASVNVDIDGLRTRYHVTPKEGVNTLAAAIALVKDKFSLAITKKKLEPLGNTGNRWIYEREFNDARVMVHIDKTERGS